MNIQDFLQTGDKNQSLNIQRRVLREFLLLQDFIGENVVYETEEIPIIEPPVGILSFPSDEVSPEIIFGLSANAGTSQKFSRGDHIHGTPEINVDGVTIVGSGKSGNPLRSLNAGVPEAPTDGVVYGRQNAGWVEVSTGADQVIINTQSTGHVTGGFITPTGGIHIHVTAGSGYITDNATFYQEVFWDAADTEAYADGRNFVMVDIDGNVFVTDIVDNYYDYIQVGVLFTGGGNTQIVSIVNSPRSIADFPQRVLRYQQIALQAIIGVGCEVTERAQPNYLQLQIAAGTIFVNMNEHVVGATNSFVRMFNTSNYGWLPLFSPPLNTIIPYIYNDVTAPYTGVEPGSALKIMQDGWWKKDLAFRTPDGSVYVICGQKEYATKDEARRGPRPTLPGQLGAVGAFLCDIICQKEDSSIVDRIQDSRPNFQRIFEQDIYASGVPAGGTGQQMLVKVDASDFNTEWASLLAAGLNQEVQFNGNGDFSTSTHFKYDAANETLLLGIDAVSENNTPLAMTGDIDSAVRARIQNINAGIDSHSEMMAVADNGSNSTNYTKFGVTGSNYADPTETLWEANSGYVVNEGGDLTVGTRTAGANILLHTGGVMAANIIAEVNDDGIDLSAGMKFSENGFNITDQITTAANASEEAAKFAAFAAAGIIGIVIRTDLL
jgi:hypothetical protein